MAMQMLIYNSPNLQVAGPLPGVPQGSWMTQGTYHGQHMEVSFSYILV